MKILKKLKDSVHVFRLDEDYIYDTKILVDRDYDYKGHDGQVMMTISHAGIITVMAGYMWDGCSPKIRFFDLDFIGTPDGIMDIKTGKRKCFFATCIHDILYKYAGCKQGVPFTRKNVDEFLLDLMQQANFSCSKLYYYVVRLLGWIMW